MTARRVPLSVLDLVPVSSGSTDQQALQASLDLVRRSEDAGYHRYWFAEHHFNPGVSWDVQNGTFPTIIPGVQNGKYDVGQDNFGVTRARVQVVDFASYLTDGQAFLAPSSSKLDKVTDTTDVCGLNIGTTPGSTFQQILTAAAPKCEAAGKAEFKVQYFSDTAPIFLGLANGKVDAYFGPTLSLQYNAIHVPDTKFLGQVSSTTVGFVTGKGTPLAKPLSDAVNKLIANGDYAKILAKWGVASSSGITRSEVNPTPSL